MRRILLTAVFMAVICLGAGISACAAVIDIVFEIDAPAVAVVEVIRTRSRAYAAVADFAAFARNILAAAMIRVCECVNASGRDTGHGAERAGCRAYAQAGLAVAAFAAAVAADSAVHVCLFDASAITADLVRGTVIRLPGIAQTFGHDRIRVRFRRAPRESRDDAQSE